MGRPGRGFGSQLGRLRLPARSPAPAQGCRPNLRPAAPPRATLAMSGEARRGTHGHHGAVGGSSHAWPEALGLGCAVLQAGASALVGRLVPVNCSILWTCATASRAASLWVNNSSRSVSSSVTGVIARSVQGYRFLPLLTPER